MAEKNEKGARAEVVSTEEAAWPKSEHVRSSLSMYGQPGWLVEALLRDVPDDQQLSRQDVQKRLDEFNNAPAKKG